MNQPPSHTWHWFISFGHSERKGESKYTCLDVPLQPRMGTVSATTWGSPDSGHSTKAAGTAHEPFYLIPPFLPQMYLSPEPSFLIIFRVYPFLQSLKMFLLLSTRQSKTSLCLLLPDGRKEKIPFTALHLCASPYRPTSCLIDQIFHGKNIVLSTSFISSDEGFQSLWGKKTPAWGVWGWEVKSRNCIWQLLSRVLIPQVRGRLWGWQPLPLLWMQYLQCPSSSWNWCWEHMLPRDLTDIFHRAIVVLEEAWLMVVVVESQLSC